MCPRGPRNFIYFCTVMREYDVIIIGGGAAGLMAAGTAAGQGYRTLLLEKMEKPARKVRITGKGRCNLTNTKPREEFLSKVKPDSDFFVTAFDSFNNLDTINFFEKRGLRLITERGDRVFPASGKAWDVADALVNYARTSGAEIECFTSVKEILTDGGHVSGVITETKGKKSRICARKVIIATGGASYPATGSTGDGYALAKSLGHKIVNTRPSLTPLRVPAKYSSLNGLALRNVRLTLIVGGKKTTDEFGEMDFTDNTACGAIVLRVSRDAVDALRNNQKVELSIDLKSALNSSKLTARIAREITALPRGASVRELMRKLIPQKLMRTVAAKSGINLDSPLSAFSDKNTADVIRTLKDFRVEISDFCPFPQAIVTAGGVDTSQVNSATLESKLVKGLYFAGEVLDIDANTGGYNLQIAFSTGHLAGELK